MHLVVPLQHRPPLDQVQTPVELTPQFGEKADRRLTQANASAYCSKFWLDKYFTKDLFFALTLFQQVTSHRQGLNLVESKISSRLEHVPASRQFQQKEWDRIASRITVSRSTRRTSRVASWSRLCTVRSFGSL